MPSGGKSAMTTDTSALQRLSAAMPLDSPQGDESSEAVEEDE